ncbi:MAG: hypothetical protein IKQ71_04020 [Lachnospiraceae bacterium]|nr:hypothetical protein [Lachnospiraceae bacterium]
MTASERELKDIKEELKSIIEELCEISIGVRTDFSGIGNRKCSECIEKVINKYNSAQLKLNRIDISKLVSGFESITGNN